MRACRGCDGSIDARGLHRVHGFAIDVDLHQGRCRAGIAGRHHMKGCVHVRVWCRRADGDRRWCARCGAAGICLHCDARAPAGSRVSHTCGLHQMISRRTRGCVEARGGNRPDRRVAAGDSIYRPGHARVAAVGYRRSELLLQAHRHVGRSRAHAYRDRCAGGNRDRYVDLKYAPLLAWTVRRWVQALC